MSVFHAFLFGAFWLILAYLAWTNAGSVSQIFTGTRNLAVADTLALQGR
jgi:hypothetical protein